MSRADDLECLLDEAREASPAERLPTYRDASAAFGEEAIEPLATWLEEPAFVDPLRLGRLNAAARPLYLSGQRDGIDWVVGMHPGGASRRGWGPSRYAGLIVDTWRALPAGGGQPI